MNKSIIGAVCAFVFSLGLIAELKADVIDANFGANYVEGTGGLPEVMLLDITYIGGGDGVFTTPMPAFPGPTPLGSPATGLPDGTGLVPAPTYVAGGDGETTRTIGVTVPINWDVASFPFPTISILSITVDAPLVGGIWTAEFDAPYTVGLIPAGIDYELESFLPVPQGDIYDDLAGDLGNPIGRVIATSSPPGYEGLIGSAFGYFIFSAASSVHVSEVCDNGVDDNGNGLVDCADPQCEGFVYRSCITGLPGICAIGTLTCRGGGVKICFPNQLPRTEGPFGDVTCGDGVDNDCDNLKDAADPDCEPVPEICDDGIDNSGDGLVDCADPRCQGFVGGACNTGNQGICAAGTTACRGLQQFCDRNQRSGTEGPFGDATCGDGLDNDCDGLTDKEDPDCIGDVFLTKLQVTNNLNLKVGERAVIRRATVRGDSNTPKQDATVVLSAAAPPAIRVVVEPASVTQQVALGAPVTQFGFTTVFVSCYAAGAGTVDWTATISATVNSDPSNDVLTGVTSVICR